MKFNKAFKNQYVFSVITKVLVVVIGFASSMFLARFLGPELKGMITTITNYSNILAIIITFGVHEAYPFYKKRIHEEDFLNNYMSLVSLMYLVYCIIATVCITISNFNLTVLLVAIMTALQGYSTVVNYVVLVEEPNNRNRAVFFINFVHLLILAICYFFLEANLFIAFSITAFTFLVEAIYFSLKLKFKIQIIKWSFAKELLSFGFFPMIALLLSTLNYRIDIVMLNRYNAITYSAIGIYSIGVSLAEKVFLIPNAVKEILLAKLAKGKQEDEVVKVIRICWPICIIATIMILLLGKPFVVFFFGTEYSDAYMITIISMIGTVFMVFFKMISTYNVVNGRQKENVLLLSIPVVINIIGNTLLIPHFGIFGAAIASDAGYLVCAVLFTVSFSRSKKIPIRNMISIRPKDFSYFFKKIKK